MVKAPVIVPIKYLLHAGSRIQRRKDNVLVGDRGNRHWKNARWEDFTTTRHAFFTEDDIIRSHHLDLVWVKLPESQEYRQIQFYFSQLEKTFTGTLHGVGI